MITAAADAAAPTAEQAEASKVTAVGHDRRTAKWSIR